MRYKISVLSLRFSFIFFWKLTQSCNFSMQHNKVESKCCPMQYPAARVQYLNECEREEQINLRLNLSSFWEIGKYCTMCGASTSDQGQKCRRWLHLSKCRKSSWVLKSVPGFLETVHLLCSMLSNSLSWLKLNTQSFCLSQIICYCKNLSNLKWFTFQLPENFSQKRTTRHLVV